QVKRLHCNVQCVGVKPGTLKEPQRQRDRERLMPKLVTRHQENRTMFSQVHGSFSLAAASQTTRNPTRRYWSVGMKRNRYAARQPRASSSQQPPRTTMK